MAICNRATTCIRQAVYRFAFWRSVATALLIVAWCSTTGRSSIAITRTSGGCLIVRDAGVVSSLWNPKRFKRRPTWVKVVMASRGLGT